ncbi:M20 family metallopeptidase [Serratia sp. L9]|uniref:M20 family metallopeptidase n=1 Tax=Serratia sp. L9 TaxID=3423946 RepID=UPI003D678836
MNTEQYLDELRSVVNIDCGTQTVAGVACVADRFATWYQQAGWHTERVNLGERVGPGMFVTNHADAEQFDVLLVGHMDTVFPEGTAAERPMTVQDGRVYGPGVSDMKSGLLNILWALRSLSPAEKERLKIAVAMNPDEETGSVFSHQWIGELAKRSAVVLVCEAARADGSLVKARKGMARYRLDFRGVAAHAGNDPHRGRSAINALAQTIVELNGLADAEAGTTLNFGVIQGGDAANIVADKAHAILDLRFWNNEEYQRVHQSLSQFCSTHLLADISIQLLQEAHTPAMAPSRDTEKLMQLVEDVGEQEGIAIHWQAVGGGSDANHTAALGVPSLDGFGPIGAGFHSPAEYLELDSIAPRIRLLKQVIVRLGQ